jgi:hypothetical protein
MVYRGGPYETIVRSLPSWRISAEDSGSWKSPVGTCSTAVRSEESNRIVFSNGISNLINVESPRTKDLRLKEEGWVGVANSSCGGSVSLWTGRLREFTKSRTKQKTLGLHR